MCYFSSRYQRSGTLWEGRFHSTVIENDSYLLACHRYIDMNPVRAGVATGPEAYTWSSHRHYSFGELDSLIEPHPLILGLATNPPARQAAYRYLFTTPLDPFELEELRNASQSCRPIGGKEVARRSPGRPKGGIRL